MTEEQGLDLHRAVALLADVFEGQPGGEPLEGVAVGAKAEVAREGDVERLVPVVVCAFQSSEDVVRFAFEAFTDQGREPAIEQPVVEPAEPIDAGNGLLAREQPVDASDNAFGHPYDDLRDERAVGATDRCVGLTDNVQDDRVVGWIRVVPMP